jgi:glycosyltransferase involved in cell wall biosynthesis
VRLVVVGPYPTDPNRITTGVEAVIVYLLEGLREITELNVEVISCQKDLTRAESRSFGGMVVHYLPSPRRFGNLTLDIAEKVRVLRKLEELRPDIVHVHDHANYPYLFRVPPCPTVTTVHGLVFKEVRYDNEGLDFLRKPFRRLLEGVVLRKAHDLIAVTPYVSDMVRPISSARIHVVENPVGERYFHVTDSERGRPHTLLFAGSIREGKNILGLLRVVCVLRDRMPLLQLRIAGGMGQVRYSRVLEAFVAANRLQENVAFLGQLSEAALLQEYSESSLVVSCSREETSGMVVQQAMAAGKASVVSRIGGFSCVVKDGETGFLFDPENVEGFAERIRLLLLDGELRRTMGERARAEALRRFTPAVIAEKTHHLYKRLVSEPRDSPRSDRGSRRRCPRKPGPQGAWPGPHRSLQAGESGRSSGER